MDLEVRENNSGAEQFFAQIGDVQKLYTLARDKTASSRLALSREIGSILESNISPREGELVADVLIDLMRQAEMDLREALSERLALLDNIPLRLVLHLANDEIDIAQHVLEKSSVLDDLDLMYIIKCKNADYWRVIAHRKMLSDQVIDTLVDTNDFDTALTLVENENISLTEHALVALSDIAQKSDVLALPLLRREDVSSEIAFRIYEYVGQQIKDFIKENYKDEERSSSVLDFVDQVCDEMTTGATSTSEAESDGKISDEDLIKTAQTAKSKGLLNAKSMMSALRRNQLRFFIIQMSVFTDLSIEKIESAASQKNGQMLALISKAYGLESKDFVSIYMLTSRLWNQGSVVDANDIKRAVEYFGKATPELARKIVLGTV